MKILLSAYSCEPGLGSEPAVGWGWASTLAQRHQVHVITRTSNRQRIEAELVSNPLPNLTFYYFDLPEWAKRWKRGNKGVHLYYLLWQLGAYRLAKNLVCTQDFDLVHHVTFVSARFPSFMGYLGLPFVFGPAAGGEYAPISLWWGLGWEARIKETLRYLSNRWIRISPLMFLTFRSANRILVTSNQTASLLPASFQHKTKQMLAISLENNEIETIYSIHAINPKIFKIFFAGRFLYWKGMEYGLYAFARLVQIHPSAHLTMIGNGPAKSRWQALANTLNISNHITWIAQMPRNEFIASLPLFDALLFPSLHDSGGMVVLEAMASGVPAICLDIAGPGVLVDNDSGIKVPISSPEIAIENLYEGLSYLASNREKCHTMGINAATRVRSKLSWNSKISSMEKIYHGAISDHQTKKC